jgi:hypothetical protein
MKIWGNLDVDDNLRAKKTKWSRSFHKNIRPYICDSGYVRDPQVWPLVRKVVLEGPWEVLSSGVCLVDLPGTMDANANRAKVTKQYLQTCSNIWIVTPIQRAESCPTVLELLGDELERRIQMEGRHGQIALILTKTGELYVSSY